MGRLLTDTTQREVTDADYRTLAAYRHELRRFLSFSEDAARQSGLTPQQHQAILAIRGFEGPGKITVGDLANQLLVRHHSAVELVDRLVKAGLVIRNEGQGDRRRVELGLTPKAEQILERLSLSHLVELRERRPSLSRLLEQLDGV
jgi:DNA-binding MarR family transcriptional regulator